MGERLALITAGMSSLGEAVSTRLADAYYRIAVTYSPGNEGAREWIANMYRRYYEVHAYECDVGDYESCRACVAQVTRECGPIDILVNNAAASGAKSDGRHCSDDPVSNMTKQVCDGMKQRGWGRVINVALANGFNGASRQTRFAASGSIHVLTQSLALENARSGVTINTIAQGSTNPAEAIPGSQILARIPATRVRAGEELPALVLYLCSDDAASLTGATIAINSAEYVH
jgi:acetoacetyl-CoA reductase